MQLPVVAMEPFDRGDRAALRRHGQSQTREGAAAVEMHRAGAALAVIAALFRARQTNLFPQCIEHCRARIGGQLVLLAIDEESEPQIGGPCAAGLREPGPAP